MQSGARRWRSEETFSRPLLDGPAVVQGVSTISLPGVPLAGSPAGPGGLESSATALTSFVVGPENRLAAAVVRGFGQPQSRHYSPIVLYGPSGSGKSHLAQGLVERWRRDHTGSPICLTTGAEFARNFAVALDRHDLTAWRRSVRSVHLFVLEDLGQLAGKPAAQVELIHVLDELAAKDAMILITARSLPQQAASLQTGLRSRLAAGLAIPLLLPGPAARRAILEQLAAARGLQAAA